MNNEATDEVWYKRAVEYHFNNPNSFVFSVPFDIGDKRSEIETGLKNFLLNPNSGRVGINLVRACCFPFIYGMVFPLNQSNPTGIWLIGAEQWENSNMKL